VGCVAAIKRQTTKCPPLQNPVREVVDGEGQERVSSTRGPDVSCQCPSRAGLKVDVQDFGQLLDHVGVESGELGLGEAVGRFDCDSGLEFLDELLEGVRFDVMEGQSR